MAAIGQFIKENVKGQAGNILFLPGYVKELGEAQNKLKAIVKITADWLFWTLKLLAPLRQFFVSGAVVLGFKSIGDAISNVVRQTGSLDAALRRLSSIQIAQRGLAPFLGGMEAAKQRVAELLVMSGKGPFKFEEIAQANKDLEIFTRGAYSSAQATQQLGKVAIATGNQIGDIASAVGEFYANLREGAPIHGSAERLRELGVISQQAANNLESMTRTGAGTMEVFNRLTVEVDKTAASMDNMSDSIETVNAEYAKAAENLKVQFGAGWTANDVQNTKNMAVVMQAIAPAVQRVSTEWARMFGGLSRVRTEIIKFLATNTTMRNGLEAIAHGFNGVLTAALAISTVALPMLIPKINLLIERLLAARLASVGLSGALPFLKGGVAIGAIGVAVTGVVSLGAAIYAQSQAHRQAIRAINDSDTAFQKSNQAIKEQIANARTLTDQHDAVSASVNQMVDAYGKFVDVQAELADITAHPFSRFSILDPLMSQKMADKLNELTVASDHFRESYGEAVKTMTSAVAQRSAALTGPALSSLVEGMRQRRFQAEQRRFETEQVLAPGRRPEILRTHAREMRRRADLGEAGATERARIEQETAALIDQQQVLKGRYEVVQKSLEVQKKAEKPNPDVIKSLEAESESVQEKMKFGERELLQRRLSAKEGTAVRKEAELERNQTALAAGAALEAGDKEAARLDFIKAGTIAISQEDRDRLRTKNLILEMEIATARQFEDQRNTLRDMSDDENTRATTLEREQRTIRMTGDLELARRRAERLGQTQLAHAIANQEEFMDRYQKYLQSLPEEEAHRRALAETQESIKERETIPGGLRAVASSLQRIGGGGGVYTPGGDPAIMIQKQLVTLARSSDESLKILAGRKGGVE